MYKQTDGLAMGNPIAPTVANIFMSQLEEKYLHECSHNFRPLLYHRYLDDTCVFFKNKDHADAFLTFINAAHPQIKFTMETESENRLPFLDMIINRYTLNEVNYFSTCVYRKPTFFAIGLSFYSFCPLKFKINAICTLVHRAFKICSNHLYLYDEIGFLKKYFYDNGYPKFLVDSVIVRTLGKILDFVPQNISVDRKIIFVSLPFYGEKWCSDLKHDLTQLISKFYPQFDVKLIFCNNFTIGSLLRTKEKLPVHMQTGLVYKYACEGCNTFYLGQTAKAAKTRWSQHLGVSCRTERLLGAPPYSAIRNHAELSGHRVLMKNFSIIAKASSDFDRKLLESLYIFKLRPPLNNTSSSVPLKVII